MPAVDWLCETRGRSTPTVRNAAWTRPEQSHELGPVPPGTYASPTCACTNATTEAAEPVADEETGAEAVDTEEPDAEEPEGALSVVRSAVREARSAASALALAAASAFFLASSLRTASALAFLAALAAVVAAASSWACVSRSSATCCVASADAATVVESPAVMVGISMVWVTGSAWAGPAAPATAMVLRTPPATPARSAVFEAFRRGFRWLGMRAVWDMGTSAIRASGVPSRNVCCDTVTSGICESAFRRPLLTP